MEWDAVDKAYHTISEVSEMLKIRPHVLRYWETQFSMLHPKKSRSGMRLYDSKDIEILLAIKSLLYEKGFKIAGARRKLLDVRSGKEKLDLPATEASKIAALASIKDDIENLVEELKKSRSGVA
ncbi:MAG: MerR family transcriptional regulator [Candidatus Eisenbacteria bacterium]|nr:MerR family transcriptional regulator [Candidatus Eisenbacteria bacterium]